LYIDHVRIEKKKQAKEYLPKESLGFLYNVGTLIECASLRKKKKFWCNPNFVWNRYGQGIRVISGLIYGIKEILSSYLSWIETIRL